MIQRYFPMPRGYTPCAIGFLWGKEDGWTGLPLGSQKIRFTLISRRHTFSKLPSPSSRPNKDMSLTLDERLVKWQEHSNLKVFHIEMITMQRGHDSRPTIIIFQR